MVLVSKRRFSLMVICLDLYSLWSKHLRPSTLDHILRWSDFQDLPGISKHAGIRHPGLFWTGGKNDGCCGCQTQGLTSTTLLSDPHHHASVSERIYAAPTAYIHIISWSGEDVPEDPT